MDGTRQRVLQGRLYRLLGDLPARERPVGVLSRIVEERERYVLERLSLDLNGIEPVPAYFVRPLKAAGKLPVVVFNHSHGGRYELGKDELLQGNTYMERPPYADEITRLGYAGLAIDAWNFGERSGRLELDLYKELLWHGMVLWGLMVYDCLKAVDYLCARDDVDASRIGTLGMSMGSTMAWWLAALDERIKVCVDICCLTDFHELVRTSGLSGHGIYYFVPGLLRQFTTARINALIAPRVHLSCAGLYDRLTPPAGLEEIDAALRKEYASHDAAANWELFSAPVGHRETFEMRRRIRQELAERL